MLAEGLRGPCNASVWEEHRGRAARDRVINSISIIVMVIRANILPVVAACARLANPAVGTLLNLTSCRVRGGCAPIQSAPPGPRC